MGANLIEFWQSLGLAAQAVVALLAFMSLISIAIVLERGVFMVMARRDTTRFVPLASAAVRSGLLAEISPLVEQCSLSPEAELVARSGVDLDRVPAGESEANRRLLLARWGIDRHLATVDLDLRRGLPILGTISATAPFVGLLGTVLGIIRAFESLGPEGGGLAGVSAGIAEALITTALGLLVAIPATWAYNFLTSRIDTMVYHARRFGAIFLESLAAGGGPATRALLKEPYEPTPVVARLTRFSVKADINVTPLVDVVLVLLIIFMVVTPPPDSVLELGLSKVVKADTGSRDRKEDQVMIRVTAGNQVYLNDREVPPEGLLTALKESLKGKTDQPLFFEAEAGADYPQVVKILDDVSAAGVGRVAIVHRRPAAN